MAKGPDKPNRATDHHEESAVLLRQELRRRGMSDAEIDQALRKKKRRRVMEFNVVKTRHLMDDPRAGERPQKTWREPRGRLRDDLCTVDEAAERLKLHPKTVLRMIREGRLRATRIGKSYRILVADLEALAGVPEPAPQAAEAAWTTSIVDVPGVGPELARKWAATVPGALNARGHEGPPMRADVVYEAERAHLKVIITGSPRDTADLLRMIGLWLDQLQP